MVAKLDRTGEENINTFGSKMIIIKYESARSVDVYFPEYNWVCKNIKYSHFKRGNIKCLYERRTCNIGYIGEGIYKTIENGIPTKCYKTWQDMLLRCYNEDYQEKHQAYKGCSVCKEWHNFQNFAEWYEKNYYEIEGEKMHLDKDILFKGNKIYSPNNCVYVPQRINSLFVKCNSRRGNFPIGVSIHDNKYQASCSCSSKRSLGLYDTPEEAFQVYKKCKESVIKEVANEYKDRIPIRLYHALIKYKVEIND